ncbi:MAG: DUF4258 domain-containing protein [Bacteroidetes bacterium]|nr:DUF4258 domain-containing protein [Bacteroidota bacterium]
MNWARRIRLYLTGFGFGLIIVWLTFFHNGHRDYGGWLPSNRVMTFLSLIKKIDVDSSLLCKMKCEGFTMDDVKKSFADGKVDFDKSQAQKEPCHEYDVKLTIKGKAREIYFSTCVKDSTAKILLFNPPLIGNNCGCN